MGQIKSYLAPKDFSPGWKALRDQFAQTNTLLYGAGTATLPLTDSEADKNFIGWWLKTTATSGTARGIYLRLYLSSGAGGEAVRFFTTVENAAPADTVNGAHISLSFGASAGNVTGEGQAVRATLHLGNRTMGGTLAAIKAEIWADGASSVPSGNTSFLRLSVGGDATGVAAVDTAGYFFELDGVTSGSGKLFYVHAPTTLAANLKVLINGSVYYLPLYSTT